MYKVEEENTYQAMVEAYELAKAHYYEVEAKSDKIEFRLDLNLLDQYMKMGLLYLVLARKDGEVIGYFANLISPDAITSRPVAKEFGIYVKPEHRKSSVFTSMLERAEEGAKKRGAYSQLLMFKEGHDVGLAEKCGYEPTERIYQKVFEV